MKTTTDTTTTDALDAQHAAAMKAATAKAMEAARAADKAEWAVQKLANDLIDHDGQPEAATGHEVLERAAERAELVAALDAAMATREKARHDADAAEERLWAMERAHEARAATPVAPAESPKAREAELATALAARIRDLPAHRPAAVTITHALLALAHQLNARQLDFAAETASDLLETATRAAASIAKRGGCEHTHHRTALYLEAAAFALDILKG